MSDCRLKAILDASDTANERFICVPCMYTVHTTRVSLLSSTKRPGSFRLVISSMFH